MMMLAYPMEERLKWKTWVTPTALGDKPVHRWYVFPHSFTDELVRHLAADWGLGPNDSVLDPFVGAGTTVLSAKQMGISATGYDLSPLAVLATRVKVADYQVEVLRDTWAVLRRRIGKRLSRPSCGGMRKLYPELVRMALPGGLLEAFDAILEEVSLLPARELDRDFFRLAAISVIPRYSRARATGGWLKWVDQTDAAWTVPEALERRVGLMLGDVDGTEENGRTLRRPTCHVAQADARSLPDPDGTFSAVITSPPYPNRHDYTRVFGVELMLAFLDWEGTRRLRYQSFHSHPEAHPVRPAAAGYRVPTTLSLLLDRIRQRPCDPRVLAMLDGYFRDVFICLRELARVSRPGARIAFVVGNAQYYGEPVPVDELTAEIGEQATLVCERILVVRRRGNSAQQMGRYGRNPSRESIVVFRVPGPAQHHTRCGVNAARPGPPGGSYPGPSDP